LETTINGDIISRECKIDQQLDLFRIREDINYLLIHNTLKELKVA